MKKIKIISSNIRFDSTDDGDHAWSHRKQILSKLLLEFDPLIIGTQEGREPQLRELEDLLPEFSLQDKHRNWIEERMYPSLFIRNDAFEIIESNDIWLSETPWKEGSSSFESAFPRLATWIKIKLNNNFLYIINLHLDHIKESTRKLQIDVLIQEMNKMNIKNDYLIVMGDFNSKPNSQVMKTLIESNFKLKDAWSELIQSEKTSYHKFLGKLDEGARIDWILHSSNIRPIEIFLDDRHINNIYPSDHFPLKCTFEILETE